MFYRYYIWYYNKYRKCMWIDQVFSPGNVVRVTSKQWEGHPNARSLYQLSVTIFYILLFIGKNNRWKMYYYPRDIRQHFLPPENAAFRNCFLCPNEHFYWSREKTNRKLSLVLFVFTYYYWDETIFVFLEIVRLPWQYECVYFLISQTMCKSSK